MNPKHINNIEEEDVEFSAVKPSTTGKTSKDTSFSLSISQICHNYCTTFIFKLKLFPFLEHTEEDLEYQVYVNATFLPFLSKPGRVKVWGTDSGIW